MNIYHLFGEAVIRHLIQKHKEQEKELTKKIFSYRNHKYIDKSPECHIMLALEDIKEHKHRKILMLEGLLNAA